MSESLFETKQIFTIWPNNSIPKYIAKSCESISRDLCRSVHSNFDWQINWTIVTHTVEWTPTQHHEGAKADRHSSMDQSFKHDVGGRNYRIKNRVWPHQYEMLKRLTCDGKEWRVVATEVVGTREWIQENFLEYVLLYIIYNSNKLYFAEHLCYIEVSICPEPMTILKLHVQV